MKIRCKRNPTWIVAGLVLSLLVASAAAAAEAPTREEYVTQLEGICKPNAEATEGAMKGVRADIKAERLAVAATKFGKASSLFAGTLQRMSAVPQPSADGEKLSKWFGLLKAQSGYLKQITTQLRAGEELKAQRLTARFIHAGNLANNSVLAFGFDYCSFKFSRYG